MTYIKVSTCLASETACQGGRTSEFFVTGMFVFNLTKSSFRRLNKIYY